MTNKTEMILFTLSDTNMLQIIMWSLGIFSTVMLTLLIHIGNAGSAIKQKISDHAERISTVEVQAKLATETAHRIEDKLDRLIERK